MNEKHEHLKSQLAILPQRPGVYLMKNVDQDVIYVGKAKNLKNRVRQYFQSMAGKDFKVQAMVNHIDSFDYVVTDTEAEALIFENNLIKKHKPLYNILLKDDKTFPYLKVTVMDEFPRLLKTRRVLRDGAKYFGPYTNVYELNEILDLLLKIYPIRVCNRNIARSVENKERPCLFYFIHKCIGPCAGNVNKELYDQYVSEILDFLNGNTENLERKLTERMQEHAKELRFEEAAELRNKIQYIHRMKTDQKVVIASRRDQDYISYYYENGTLTIQVFKVKKGKLLAAPSFFYEASEDTVLDDYFSFVKQYYLGAFEWPDEIYLEEPDEDLSVLESVLSERKKKKVSFKKPLRGGKKRLLALTQKNAKLYYLKNFVVKGEADHNRERLLKDLAQMLNLPEVPKRIESFDISNIQGVDSVGSQVVFIDGKKVPGEYRRYKIKSVTGANDYASMVEIVERRLRHENHPDLMLLDGGKGHVSTIRTLLDALELAIPVFGMVKNSRHRTEALCDEKTIYPLEKKSPLFQFVAGIQDEVHRFAISYHKSLRKKKMQRSKLDRIAGVGSKRKQLLFQHFKTLDNVKKASLEELKSIKGIDSKTASNIYYYFNPERKSDDIR